MHFQSSLGTDINFSSNSGVVISVERTQKTQTTSSGGGGYVSGQYGGYISAPVTTTRTTTYDRYFYKDAQGKESYFTITNGDFPIRAGHHVSLIHVHFDSKNIQYKSFAAVYNHSLDVVHTIETLKSLDQKLETSEGRRLSVSRVISTFCYLAWFAMIVSPTSYSQGISDVFLDGWDKFVGLASAPYAHMTLVIGCILGLLTLWQRPKRTALFSFLMALCISFLPVCAIFANISATHDQIWSYLGLVPSDGNQLNQAGGRAGNQNFIELVQNLWWVFSATFASWLALYLTARLFFISSKMKAARKKRKKFSVVEFFNEYVEELKKQPEITAVGDFVISGEPESGDPQKQA